MHLPMQLTYTGNSLFILANYVYMHSSARTWALSDYIIGWLNRTSQSLVPSMTIEGTVHTLKQTVKGNAFDLGSRGNK